jgi:hypothetical protein
MAWAEFFGCTNIPFAVAQSASFKKALKMTSEIKRSYLLPLYHDIPKKLFNDTKNKIKVQIADRTKMFIRAYGRWLEFGQHPSPSKYDVCLFGWQRVLGGY